MATIVMTCAQCGREFTPTTRDIVRRDWRRCPACRPAPSPQPPVPTAERRETTPEDQRLHLAIPVEACPSLATGWVVVREEQACGRSVRRCPDPANDSARQGGVGGGTSCRCRRGGLGLAGAGLGRPPCLGSLPRGGPFG